MSEGGRGEDSELAIILAKLTDGQKELRDEVRRVVEELHALSRLSSDAISSLIEQNKIPRIISFGGLLLTSILLLSAILGIDFKFNGTGGSFTHTNQPKEGP